MESLTIVSAKYYANVFGVSYATAKAWLKDDLLQYKRKRFTFWQFCVIYKSLDSLDFSNTKLKK